MAKLTYEQESEIIRENKGKPATKQAHNFKPANWTFPNGHPRCLTCGDEETMTGKCNDDTTKMEAQPVVLKQLAEILTILKQVVEAPVSGLSLVREDLGVRHGPKSPKKLPEVR